jgi:predicted transcriptional regulator
MTIGVMPNQPREGRAARGVRIDDTDWDDLGDIADAMERDRGWVIRKLIAWYLGRPDAELPERPGKR